MLQNDRHILAVSLVWIVAMITIPGEVVNIPPSTTTVTATPVTRAASSPLKNARFAVDN